MKNYLKFLFLSLLFIFAGCSKDELPVTVDPPQPVDEYEGNYTSFTLNGEASDFHIKDWITCYFKAADGTVIKRGGILRQQQGEISTFMLAHGLKEGEYRLLRLEFEISDPITGKNISDNYGVGCMLSFKNGSVTVLSTYTAKVRLCGSGTADNPYIISAPGHLSIMRKIINDENSRKKFKDGCYFRQECDIDMGNECLKCSPTEGWSAIGNSIDSPFRYHYDGGNYTISKISIKQNAAGGAGLFGFVNNAMIHNVHITDSEITGLYGVGAIAGMAVASGSQGNASIIRGCSVNKTTIRTPILGIGTGGILGAVDANAKVWIDSCLVSGGHISGSYGAGGILGGGYALSKSIITNCRNESTDITAQYTGAGGIVGSADTLLVASCINNGHINGSTDNRTQTAGKGCLGTGGIAGSSGISAFYACTNKGQVDGIRGVGGILGSTLVSDQDASQGSIYNFTFFSACNNTGNISGNRYIGGICGEGQAGCYGSYNKGTVSGDNEASYAGGIVGAATVCAIHNTSNFGIIRGKSYCGGIIARATFCSLAIDHNFGIVNGQGHYIAGVVGLAGGSSVIHYCSNWAQISSTDISNKDKDCGGIVGGIGNTSSWTEGNVTACVFSSAESAIYMRLPVCGTFSNETTGLSPDVSITGFGVNSVFDLIDNGITEFSSLLQATGTTGTQMIPALKTRIQSDMSTTGNELFTLIDEGIRTLPAIPVLNDKCIRKDYNLHRQQLSNYYETSGSEYMNRTINQKREEIRQETLNTHDRLEVTYDFISGSTLACSATLLSTTVKDRPAAEAIVSALTAEGSFVSNIGGPSSVWVTCSDLAENTAIVSQCINGGYILTQSGGGVVGRLEENCRLNDCLNLGACSSIRNNTGGLVAFTGWNCSIEHNLNLSVEWYEAIGNPFGIMKPDTHYNYSVYVFSSPDRAHRLMHSEIGKQDTYKGWDFDRLWKLPAYSVDICFPVPYLSEMSDQTN